MARPNQEKTATKEATDKWARLRQVAAEEAKEADAALAEVADALGTMADALSAFRENLDLIEAPKTASIKSRIESARKYASAFRRMAEESPEVVADALSEVYHSLDDVAGAIENLAENMGIELNLTPAEESFAEEGQEELAGDIPAEEEEAPVVDSDEGLHGEQPTAEVEEEPKEEVVEEEEVKEASGSDQFVSDRDEQGEPKSPVIASKDGYGDGKPGCSQCGPGHEDPKKPGYCERHGKKIRGLKKEKKKADGSAAFVTDRDNSAKPEAPAKTEAPEAQGETEVGKAAAAREALRQRIAKRWHVEL